MTIHLDPKSRLPAAQNLSACSSPKSPSSAYHATSLMSMKEASSDFPKLYLEKAKLILQKYTKITLEFLTNMRANLYFFLDPPLELSHFSAELVSQKKSKEEVLKLFQSLSFVEKAVARNAICQRKNNPLAGNSFADDCIKNDPFDKDVLFAIVDAITELKTHLPALQKFKETLFNYSSTPKEVIDAFNTLSAIPQQLIKEDLLRRTEAAAPDVDWKKAEKIFESDPKNVGVKCAAASWIQKLKNN